MKLNHTFLLVFISMFVGVITGIDIQDHFHKCPVTYKLPITGNSLCCNSPTLNFPSTIRPTYPKLFIICENCHLECTTIKNP